jgi:hypothetical protein
VCRFADVSYIRIGFLVVGAHNSGLVTVMFALDHCELLTEQHKKSEIQIGVNTFMKDAFCVFHTRTSLGKFLIRFIMAEI